MHQNLIPNVKVICKNPPLYHNFSPKMKLHIHKSIIKNLDSKSWWCSRCSIHNCFNRLKVLTQLTMPSFTILSSKTFRKSSQRYWTSLHSRHLLDRVSIVLLLTRIPLDLSRQNNSLLLWFLQLLEESRRKWARGWCLSLSRLKSMT